MICPVCKRRRLNKNMSTLAVPVTFTMNYETDEKVTFPAGTKVCPTEWRAMNLSTSDGQQIRYKDGRWQRVEDGKSIYAY